MTDDNQHMNEQLPPLNAPGQPSRTDAPALRDADALDAGLDARALSSHTGAPAAPTPAWGQNGQGSTAIAATGTASLVGAASRFHARFAAAEEAEAPPAPVDAIWEQIMGASILTPAAPIPPPAAHAHATRPARPERHPFLRTAGSHPAATAVLVATVILATILVFRALDRNTPPPIIDQGPAALAPGGSATPTASPPAAACTYSVMTDAEAAALIAQATPRTARDYLPITTPVSAADAQAALEARRGFAWCDRSQEVRNAPFYLQRASLETDARMAQVVMQATPASLVQQVEESVALTKALSPVLATPNPAAYIVDPNDPAITPYLIPDALGQGAPVNALLPQDFVTLPDGRIGAPLKTARVGGAGTAGSSDYLSSQGVNFVVFAQVNGQWMVDTSAWLCTANCDAYYAEREDYIASLRTWADQSASPQASPPPAVASPSAIQLSTPDANGCIIRTLSPEEAAAIANPAAMPTPDYTVAGPLDDEAITRDAATAWAGSFGCHDVPLADNQEAGAVSLYLLATVRQGGTPETRIPLAEQRLTVAEALSSTLVQQDPTHYIVDSDDPAITPWLGTDGNGRQYVILPQDMARFEDGRVGAPVKLARQGGAGTATRNSYMSPQTVTYVFFRQEGGVWLVDEQLSLCTWMCDDWFAARQRDIDADRAANGMSTPVASPGASPSTTPTVTPRSGGDNLRPGTKTPVATPALTDSDLAFWLSIPGVDECVLPDGGPFTSNRPREYLPWTASGDTTARQVALADRNRVACDQRSGLVPGSGLYTSRYIGPAVPGSAVDAETLTRMQALSAAIPDQDPAAWVHQGRTGAAGLTGDAAQRYAVLPENVYRLPDGRYAAIPVTIATDAATILANGAVTLPVAIYAQSGDAWLLDEQIAVCLGDCQAYWNSFHVIDAPPGTPGTPATPADLAIAPIDRRTLAVA